MFGDVAEQWYATKLHLRPSTLHIYRTLLDRHIVPTFAERPVGAITTLDVQMWISDRHRNTRMGANSVAKTYKVFRCWVSEYQALPELDANGHAVAFEHIVLQNEGWVRDVEVPEPAET